MALKKDGREQLELYQRELERPQRYKSRFGNLKLADNG